MIRRLLTVSSLLAAVVLAVLMASTPAVAAPYPPSNPASISASAYDPCAGASNIIGGNGFQAGETVALVLANTGEIGRAVVGADGSFRITVTIPLEARGSDQVTATGQASGLSASLTLAFPCVVGQSAGGTRIGSGGLASTGAVVGGAVVAGLALLGAGGIFLAAGRRRSVRAS